MARPDGRESPRETARAPKPDHDIAGAHRRCPRGAAVSEPVCAGSPFFEGDARRIRVSEVDMDTLLHPLPRVHAPMKPACAPVVAALLSLSLLALVPRGAGAQSADDGYRPGPDDTVNTLALQPDGKLLVGGEFLNLGGQGAERIARVEADGRRDATFNANADAAVHAIALQSDGKLYVAGDFGTISGQQRNRLARLNPDGSLDEAFGDVNANSAIYALAVEADGRLIAGGEFHLIGGQSRDYLARFHADGSFDTSFNPQLPPSPHSYVSSMVLQPDGKLIIGGGFTTVGGHPSSHVARLNGDGSVDTTFTANGEAAFALALQPDGKILVAAIEGVYRLNADGSRDTGFDVHTSANAPSGPLGTIAPLGVLALALEADGSVLLAGAFTSVNGEARTRVARVHSDGSLDAAFAPEVTGQEVRALAVQADGKPVIGGRFWEIAGHTLFELARFYPAGRLDATWTLETPRAQDIVTALAVQPDGKWVVGGGFTSIGGQARNYLARIEADGSVDAVFNPNANNIVNAVVVQPDGKLLVGGFFGTIGGVDSSLLARLNADGTGDEGFTSDIAGSDSDSAVVALLPQPDGKIVVAGNFYTVDGESRPYLARLDSEGHLDAAFNPNPNDYVYALALQDDGKLLVGGVFSMIGGQARNGIARFNADGSLDTAYDPSASGGGVFALAVQSDGKAVVGGFFTAMGGRARNRIARLEADGSVDGTYDPNANGTVNSLILESDGRLLAGGAFTEIGGAPRNRIARISYGGGADTAFDPDADGSVFALGLQFDGKAVAAGGFTHIGGLARSRIARLSTPEAAQQTFEVSGDAVTWTRSDRGAGLALPPQLLLSTDNREYELVGTMQRIDGSWRYEGFTPPPGHDAYWLRVRGPVRSGSLNGSGGVIESTRMFYLQRYDDRIFANGFE
jgi:uncharacterized delta-60 repeat protein